jgi:hypothetical protein
MGTESSGTYEKDWINVIVESLKNWINKLWTKWTKEETDLMEEIEEEIQ